MKVKLFFTGMLCLFVLASCKQRSEEHQDDEHEMEEHAQKNSHAHSDEIVLGAEKAKAAGVISKIIHPGSFYEIIATGGEILSATGDETTLVANVAGVVSFSRIITEGMHIGKGSGLFIISSEHMQNGDPNKRAYIVYETARKEFERAQNLVRDKIVSEKEFNAIKENYETARIAYEAVSQNRSKHGVVIKSTINGYVKSCYVKAGDYVSVGQPLMSITQNRNLYLKADVSERYYSTLGTITSAKFKTSYSDVVYDIKRLNGHLLAYGKSSGDKSSYIPVTFEFNNCSGIIPGSFAEVFLVAGEKQHVISLPATAIIEEQGLNFVYLQMDETCYKKQEVKLGATDGQRYEIISGLKDGERVVTKGAIHVKLASASNIIPAHTHHH